MRKIWVAYDGARGLPVAVADSSHELARIVGANVGTVKAMASKLKLGTIKNSKYAVVEVEDDD